MSAPTRYVRNSNAGSMCGFRWKVTVHRPHQLWSLFLAEESRVLDKIEEHLHPVYLESMEHLDRLFYDFSHGTVVTVSDGSFIPDMQQAACAWVLSHHANLSG